jgi:hypothetical protein
MAHRTALITAGSIGIVVFAAAIAIGANLGILSVADSRPVGKLSASATAQPGGLQMAAVPVPTSSPAPSPAQKYVIRKAGTVSVSAGRAGLRLVDVTAKRGWTWSLTQSSDKKLLVTFKSPTRTYEFLAALGRHRSIVARVDEPVTKVMSSGSSTAVAWSPAPAAPAVSQAPAPAASAVHDSGEGSGGGEADD